jgi:L,D-transpeptidase YcbB
MMQGTVCSRICMLWMVVFACLCARSVAAPQPAVLQLLSASMPEQLRNRIEAVGHPPSMSIQRKTIGALDSLVRFYEQRGFRPVWIGDEGWLPQADALVQVISQAAREGIKSARYHLSRVEQLMAELGRRDLHNQSQTLRSWIDLELLLSDAFFMYGSHVLTGQIDPRDLQEVWFAERSPVDRATALQRASDTDRVAELLQNLRPAHAGYASRQKALALYRDIAARGGWPIIPDGPKLQRGDRGPRGAALPNRLLLTADLNRASAPVGDVFDVALEHGLQSF